MLSLQLSLQLLINIEKERTIGKAQIEKKFNFLKHSLEILQSSPDLKPSLINIFFSYKN